MTAGIWPLARSLRAVPLPEVARTDALSDAVVMGGVAVVSVRDVGARSFAGPAAHLHGLVAET
jgi:hypothetical protein